MKHLRFLLCLALVVTLLTACGPKGDGSASSSGSGGSSVSSSGSVSDPEPAPVPAQSHPGGPIPLIPFTPFWGQTALT